jgi:heptosyltransferase-2
MAEAEPQNILLVQTAFLGDVVLFTPLIAAARARFPRSRLAFLGAPAGCELLRGLPGLDEVIAYDKRGREAGLAGLRAKARELKERGFDLALSGHRSARTAFLLALAGIPRRIGFGSAAVPWLYHRCVPRRPDRHEIRRNLELLAPFGGPPADFVPRPLLPELPPAGDDLLAPGPRPRVGLCPGSVWPTKRWSAAGFARVADGLRERLGASIYLIGAPDDRPAADEVVAAAREGLIDRVGRTGLRDWVRLIAAMDLIVTNDSAPTHIASALRVPVAVLFGPTTPAQGFAPWGGLSRELEVAGLSCRPCGEHGARRCPEGRLRCMEDLDPARVIEAATALLAEAVA